MIKINNLTLLLCIQDYFKSIGLKKEAENLFTDTNFEEGMVLCLPDVCLLPKNKPDNSRSKQTHIHVTGDNRYFYFPKEEVDNIVTSSLDKRQEIDVAQENIINLKERTIRNFDKLNVISTFTMTKVAYRSKEKPQVQISKITKDGSSFINLREGLFTRDLLIFLKYVGKDRFFVVGIPLEFYENKYDITTDIIKNLESTGKLSIKTALKCAEDSFDYSVKINNSTEIMDVIYQQLIDLSDSDEGSFTPIPYVESNGEEKYSTSNRPVTNPGLGKATLKSSGYKCAFTSEENAHTTFLKPDGTPYLEVHHLIPLENQHLFFYKLDTRANLIPLCPICHRKLHYGCKEDIEPMLEYLYEERCTQLEESGLNVSISLLKEFY